jgi:hypothetical protein
MIIAANTATYEVQDATPESRAFTIGIIVGVIVVLAIFFWIKRRRT